MVSFPHIPPPEPCAHLSPPSQFMFDHENYKEVWQNTNMRFDFFVCVWLVIVIILYELHYIKFDNTHIINSVIKLF